MRVSVNSKFLAFSWLIISGLIATCAVAGEFSARIKSAELVRENGWYILEADLEPNLSPLAKEAIQSNIALVWCLKVELKQVRYFHDKPLVALNYPYKIRYHGLLNSYSVTNETTHEQKKYTSLNEALAAFSTIRGLKVLPLSRLKPHKPYKAALQLEFDKTQLPPPLRPLAYLNSEWNLSSDWYLWLLKE
jgi:hypothetical protein